LLAAHIGFSLDTPTCAISLCLPGSLDRASEPFHSAHQPLWATSLTSCGLAKVVRCAVMVTAVSRVELKSLPQAHFCAERPCGRFGKIALTATGDRRCCPAAPPAAAYLERALASASSQWADHGYRVDIGASRIYSDLGHGALSQTSGCRPDEPFGLTQEATMASISFTWPQIFSVTGIPPIQA
jgi:hypothetical protein